LALHLPECNLVALFVIDLTKQARILEATASATTLLRLVAVTITSIAVAVISTTATVVATVAAAAAAVVVVVALILGRVRVVLGISHVSGIAVGRWCTGIDTFL
jgi:hypothetical protein